jgi:V-type H+-transporting ATPase subunit a
VFTIITFPFLFAVMFGDVGHAILMLLFAWWLVHNEVLLAGKKLSENVRTAFDGRYMLLLMGAFSLYTGLLYNECFSIPMNLFGSNWRYTPGSATPQRISTSGTYIFGVDPAWCGASNELSFYNSLKMKLAIVLGVAQMLLGILLSAYNARFFRKPYDFWFEFVPRMVFMTSLFGYLVLLIFLKWGMDFSYKSSLAPSLLLSFINMALLPTSFARPEDQLYSGQLGIQQFLLFVAVISVPCMLLPKPLLLRRDHYRKLAGGDQPYQRVSLNDNENDRARGSMLDDEDEHAHGGEHEVRA